MTRWGTDLVLVLCAVNINEPVMGIGVVVVDAVKPENPRHDQIVGGRQWILRPKRHPAAKDRSVRHVAPDFLGNPEITGGRLERAFLGSNAETRGRNWIGPDGFALLGQSELLVTN